MEWRTPITPLYGMEGNHFYIKREDLLPFSFGGNKVRIARELFADMDLKGGNCMIGYGDTRSNLSRAIANISSQRKGVCHIVLPADDDGSHIWTNNSAIVEMCDAHLHFCKKDEVADAVQAVWDECVQKGMKPYYIYGDKYGHGNEEVPLRAYVKVFREIQNQADDMGIQFDYIFLATGTGMTQAGMIAGAAVYGLEGKKIIGISVSREKVRQEKIINDMLSAFSNKNNVSFEDSCIEVCDEYIGGGYGKYNKDIIDTIKKMMVLNGIPLDPIYTGKAFWGMLQYMKSREIAGKNVLFIHTGGAPLFFDNIRLMK